MSLVRLLIAIAVILMPSVLSAEVDAAAQQKIIAGLKKWRPDLNYTNIMATPISGLYHVQIIGGPSIYTSADGSYFVQGDLKKVRLGSTENWLDGVYAPMRRDLIEAANVDDMVVFKARGATKAIVYIFTDIDCGYCLKMHREVPALNKMGVEVRYLAFPRAGMGSGSERKLTSIWCASNPVDAMDRMKQGRGIAPATCDTTAISDHMKLVEQMGITGTPALILADGTLVSGYRTASKLKQILKI